MKKKIISCLLAISLIAGLAIPAFAVDETTPITEPPAQEEQTPEAKPTEKSVPAPIEKATPTVEVSKFSDLETAVKNEAVREIIITADITGDDTVALSIANRTAPLTIRGATDKKPTLDFSIWCGGENIIGTDKSPLTVKNIIFKPTDTAKLSDDKIAFHFVYSYGKTDVSGCVFDASGITTTTQKIIGVLSWGKTIAITGNEFVIPNVDKNEATAKNNYGIYYFPCTGQTAAISGNDFTGMTGKHIDLGLDDTSSKTGLDIVKPIGANTWSTSGLNVYMSENVRDLGAGFGTKTSSFKKSTDPVAKFAAALQNSKELSVLVEGKAGKAELYPRDKKSYHVANGKSVDYLGVATDNWTEIASTEVTDFGSFKTAVDAKKPIITLTQDIKASDADLLALQQQGSGNFYIINAMSIPYDVTINGAENALLNFGLVCVENTKVTLNDLKINVGNTIDNGNIKRIESTAVWTQGKNELTVNNCDFTVKADNTSKSLVNTPTDKSAVRAYGILAHSAKVSITDSTFTATTDGTAKNKFSYGLFVGPTANGGDGSNITGNTFGACDMNIGIQSDSTDYYDISDVDSDFTIGKHDQTLKVYYTEMGATRQTALDALNFGTKTSTFAHSDDPLFKYFNERPSVILATIANSTETVLERDNGPSWQYWANNGNGPAMPDVIGNTNWFNRTYKIEYADGGAAGDAPLQSPLLYGADFTVAASTNLINSGKTFQHWKDADGNIYAPGSTIKMPAKDLILTAVWLTTAETPKDVPAIDKNNPVAIPGGTDATTNIVAKVPSTEIAADTTATIKLPAADKGTVTSIEVPKAALAAATVAAPIVLTVADSNSKEQATWKFTTAPTATVDLMVEPQVPTMLNATGLDADSAALLEGAVDVINFSHNDALPTGTDIIVPTGLGNGEVYVYKLDGTNKPMLSSIVKGTVDASKLTFAPPSCSNWAAFEQELAAPSVTPTPPPTGPSHSYGGGGSSSNSDKTAELSANTPEGISATVDSSVTNIANPVLDVKATAANAPEVAEFIKATTGFAVAKVFQINMFDSTTVVKQVEGGKVEITLPFTAPDTSKQYVVLRYNDDKTVTVIPATIADGKITFKTDHFSTYAIAVKSDNPNLFVDTTVNQPTIPSSPTTVPKTGIALLGRLF